MLEKLKEAYGFIKNRPENPPVDNEGYAFKAEFMISIKGGEDIPVELKLKLQNDKKDPFLMIGKKDKKVSVFNGTFINCFREKSSLYI